MTSRIQIQTPSGTLEGQAGQGVQRFSAVPYAKPPVAGLRWEVPQATRWSGVLDATRPGPIAPQVPSRLRRVMGDFFDPQSEDCLSLTVWTPAADKKKRPVVVWLHGGAWQSGAGALDWYDGAHLAATGDVVVVSPNYRLAALGWLSVPGQPANLGLLDQEAAIDWVMDNIEAFGGDPDRVTVMGQSAGATSIACMLARKPRFSRAIIQSAGLGRVFRTAAEGEAMAVAVLEAAGVSGVEAARKLPVQALLDAQSSQQVADCLAAEGAGRSIFSPVLDGQVLPLDIDAAFKLAAGRADVIIGATRNEMAAFAGFGVDERSDEVGRQVFGNASLAWAAQAGSLGRKAWAYRFDYGPTAEFGACHCIELPFVFGTRASFAGAPMLAGASEEDTSRLCGEIQQAWLDFVRGGSPAWAPGPQAHIFN
ncbi:MAG: carboxylesterase family protein [Pseudomonadota bacterium]